jgi:polygalacturonase
MYKIFFLTLIASGICSFSAKASSCWDDNDTTLTVAAGDTTLQTNYIQKAIDYCTNTGGGTVRLTAGTYRTAPISMKSNVTLRIDSGATLLGSPNMADWTVGGSLKNLINNSGSISNVTITGQGTVDGSGAPWWAAFNANSALNRPRLIYLSNVTNLTIDSITITNSPMFHIVPNNCKNVVIDHVTINTINTSPNTDGIDPSQCYNVLITNCSISDGDDNIAIKSSGAYGFGGCQDITVANCSFGYGHGLSIGSGTSSGYTNLRVTGCTFNGTTAGIRIKSGPGEGGMVSNVYYSNITMKNVTTPIEVDYLYQNKVTTPPDIPALSGLYINNLTATGSSNAGAIAGLSYLPLENIVFSNVNISAKSGMKLSYADKVTFKNVIINKAPAKSGTNVTVTGVTNATGF